MKNNTIKEVYTHGNTAFSLGVHKTFSQVNPEIPPDMIFDILYSHWHTEFEIFYVREGTINFVIGDNEYTLSGNQAIFINSNIDHSAYLKSNRDYVCYFALVFSPSMLFTHPEDDINIEFVRPIANGDYYFGPVFTANVPWQKEVLDHIKEIVSFYDESTYDRFPNNILNPEIFLRADSANAKLKIRSLMLDIWYLCFCNKIPSTKKTE